ncbi:Calcineurin-like metallo-phosphoesterase superfamily protein isoform 2 [Hibiscus syriacus]|uniref:Calcineurin-like metallo-phosphoesterase superfamily protein isoform 2 n=1 Tax=Hibiscus syriacus TaxID=106335 RepID=A0A6A2YLX8_HIBSY|nr:Calcineurin-like metallo-phosphoesterase superfamily protein isoform 2 [Hibiscus syriacus]
MKKLVAAVLAAVLQLLLATAASVDDHHLLSRIAFGSCANQSAPQPIWDAINEFDPQVFIWLGDNIYGDIRRPFSIFGKERTIGPWKNAPRFVPSPYSEMLSRYNMAKNVPGYSRLRAKAKVIGTWDDHDYGLNDAGKEFSGKTTNQRLLLDFLDEPQDSPRRKQAGVYTSYTFGPSGKQIILLDIRYYRDPLSSGGSVLGASQWTWLEREMRGPPSALTIIVSSVQVISNLSGTTGPLFYMESWGRFPKERNHLFKLINDKKVLPSRFHFIVRFLAWFTPSTMRVMNQHCRYRSCTYGQPNFGAFQIDWDASPINLKMQVRDINGLHVTGVDISLSELQAWNSTIKAGLEQKHCTLEVKLPWIVRYRLAILVYSVLVLLLLALVGLISAGALLCRACLKKCKTD